MVYINSKKFACTSESCIKGHRSSSCHHNDRPLFEIKKKGRPVSQCDKCRELRKSKKVHSKCTCNERDSEAVAESSKASLGVKARRFIPIIPALPNGLQDVLQSSQITGSSADARQRVDSLLNPCKCRSVWNCKCQPSAMPASPPMDSTSTLATALPPEPSKSPKRRSARPSSPSNSNNRTSNKRRKHSKHATPPAGPDLAPILLSTFSSSSDHPPPRLPSFETMPPMSTIKSLAGSGCTCGFQCACPGCVEHRGPAHVSTSHKDCADGCGTCIDHSLGLTLPTSSNHVSDFGSSNILDRFFARAASLPTPPTNRKIGGGASIDPMDVTVYPESVFFDSNRAIAFGLITIPKLECCGGICGCPEGTCGCGKACDGCCKDHYTGQDRPLEERQDHIEPTLSSNEEDIVISPISPIRSCCANKTVPLA